METKTIPDNQIKARFLQLYQNTHVCFEGISNSLWSVGNCSIKGSFINSGDRGKIYLNDVPPLILKSLDNITDDDAYNMALYNRDLIDNKNYDDLVQHSKDNIYYDDAIKCLKPHHYDYLRSKGYAVPYLNYSVQDLIDFGWIKLK
jgi:hypothetical protein